MKDSICSRSNLEKKLHRSARLLSWSGRRRCLTTPSWTVTSYRLYLLQPATQRSTFTFTLNWTQHRSSVFNTEHIRLHTQHANNSTKRYMVTATQHTCQVPLKTKPVSIIGVVLFEAGRPSCQPTNSVKALKGSPRTDSNQWKITIHWPHPLLIHHWPPEGRDGSPTPVDSHVTQLVLSHIYNPEVFRWHQQDDWYWPAGLTAAKLSQCQHHYLVRRRLLTSHTSRQYYTQLTQHSQYPSGYKGTPKIGLKDDMQWFFGC